MFFKVQMKGHVIIGLDIKKNEFIKTKRLQFSLDISYMKL